MSLFEKERADAGHLLTKHRLASDDFDISHVRRDLRQGTQFVIRYDVTVRRQGITDRGYLGGDLLSWLPNFEEDLLQGHYVAAPPEAVIPLLPGARCAGEGIVNQVVDTEAVAGA